MEDLKELLEQAVMVVAYRDNDIDNEDGSFATTDIDCILKLEESIVKYFELPYDFVSKEDMDKINQKLSEFGGM